MRKQLFSFKCFFLFLTVSLQGYAQTESTTKIKVILLGTFHYGQTSDKNKIAFLDEFSEKRQRELEQLTEKLAKQNPNKIFIEAEPKRQQLIDSLYQRYRNGQLTDSSWLRNEIVQLGFRTMAKATAASMVCVDHQQELPYEAMQTFEKEHKDDKTPPFFDSPWPFTDAGRFKLKDTDLAQYYKQINNSESRQRNMYDYLHYSLSYGKGDDYTGVEFVTSWYNRNFKVMTNIFRSLQPTDKCIVIIMGSSHTAVLYELLKDHPKFEIVEVSSFL